jgi:hypothetical protein
VGLDVGLNDLKGWARGFGLLRLLRDQIYDGHLNEPWRWDNTGWKSMGISFAELGFWVSGA